MDIREFENLITKANKEVEEAREETERGMRRKTAEGKLKLVQSQLASVEKIIDELSKLNREPSDYVNSALIQLRKEEQILVIEMEELGEVPFYQEPKKTDVQYAEVVLESPFKEEITLLIQEGRTTKLNELSSDIRRLLFDQLAIRWRIVGEKIGQDKVSRCREMQTCYAVIKTAMNENPSDRHHIPALKREIVDNWELQLRQTNAKIKATQDREMRFQLALEQLQSLKKMTLDAKTDADGLKRYKHLVRTIAVNSALRDDLSTVCAPYKALLDDEFGFLWKESADEEEAVQKDKLTNRDVLSRLLRRMISKTLIGGCHGPLDRVCTGFPEHDKGRARHIMNLLIRVGAIRAKKNEGADIRVSIEPAYVGQCENFIKGAEFGQKAIDVWLQSDTAVEAEK